MEKTEKNQIMEVRGLALAARLGERKPQSVSQLMSRFWIGRLGAGGTKLLGWSKSCSTSTPPNVFHWRRITHEWGIEANKIAG